MRAERDKRDVSLKRMAEETKIPMRSLELLEAGQFEALPGDVFVRGFITAYANCLRLDTASIIDRYQQCKATEAPQPLHLEAATIDDDAPEAPTLPAAVLMADSQPRKRMGVTFAVILLLIVATLTISYFLRSTDSAGDGVTMLRSALG